jgi:Na+-driven multidrug efflux pump
VVNLMGHAAEIPALGAAMRILQLLLIPVWGAGQALQPVAGTNFGAGRHTRVLRAWQVFTLFSSLIAIALWIPAMAFPSRLLNIFMANPASIGSAAGYLRLYLISYPGYGLMLMTLTLLQATGKALAAALLAAGKFIIAFVPALLVLTPLMGIRGVFLAAPAADFVVILAGSILLALDFPGRRPGKASALRASA